MNNETKQCQNCQKQFNIDPEDFDFYEKINVPKPTWCPQCRMIRRMSYRNERSLYKSQCALCQKTMLSMYAPESPFIVYCKECWYSDKWDATTYGSDYDFNKTFFEQLFNLRNQVPRVGLMH
ncbi:MAG: hypothetical protein Q7R95_09420, partial [bacterium]|nr:hypothetical protein [bacterium]